MWQSTFWYFVTVFRFHLVAFFYFYFAEQQKLKWNFSFERMFCFGWVPNFSMSSASVKNLILQNVWLGLEIHFLSFALLSLQFLLLHITNLCLLLFLMMIFCCYYCCCCCCCRSVSAVAISVAYYYYLVRCVHRHFAWILCYCSCCCCALFLHLLQMKENNFLGRKVIHSLTLTLTNLM